MEKKDTITLSRNLENLLKERGIGKNDADRIFNLSSGSMSKYTKGVTFPKIETMVKMAKYFSVSLDALVYGNIEHRDLKQGNVQVDYSPSVLRDGEGPNYDGEDSLRLNSSILLDTKKMDKLVRFLKKYDSELRKDILFNSHMVSIETDAVNTFLRESAIMKLLKDKKPNKP